MSRRYKLTGCARFFFFLIIFVPVAYFGLQFFAGDDHRVQEMKELVDNTVHKVGKSNTVEKILKDNKESNTTNSVQNADLQSEIEYLKDELARQDELIRQLREEIEALKE